MDLPVFQYVRDAACIVIATLAWAIPADSMAQAPRVAVDVDQLVTIHEPGPKGYRSSAEAKAAAVLGSMKLVDRDLVAPDSIRIQRGVVYGRGGDSPLQLDLYSPRQVDSPVPGLILIHGGAWKGGKRSDYHFYGVTFAQAGYVVATISYRLVPTAIFPAQVHDVKCAVRWMRTHAQSLKVDPERIAAMGGSAGGHLALMLGYTPEIATLEGQGGHAGVSSRVQAVIDLYGPTDLTTEFATGNEVVKRFFGGKTYDEERDQYELASPIKSVTKSAPPTLIIHGTIDEIVPVGQADQLAARLRQLGVPYDFDRLEGWPHALDIAQVTNQRCVRIVTRFLNKHFGKRPTNAAHGEPSHLP